MEYRYETHCHSSQCSGCAKSTSQELVRAYHAAGYAGLVLTDHFIWGNTAVDKALPWDQRMKAYYQGYLDAKVVGDELDFDVIYALEHAYGDGKGDMALAIGFDAATRDITFRMSDKGTPFDPLKKPDPDITLSAEAREIGGLGIFITKKTMDTVSYAYENGENILTMIKKI